MKPREPTSIVMRLALALMEHSASSFSYLSYCIFDGCFIWNGQLNKEDTRLAPDDHVWLGVGGSERNGEAVVMGGEVHCDLLIGA